VSNVWFQDRPIGAKPVKEKTRPGSGTREAKTQAENIDTENSTPVTADGERTENKEKEKFVAKSETKSVFAAPGSKKPELRSASSLRKQSSQIRKQVVEVNWEEPKITSGSWYFFATVLAAIFAIGLLLTMLTIH
jgi:hypothetical protein